MLPHLNTTCKNAPIKVHVEFIWTMSSNHYFIFHQWNLKTVTATQCVTFLLEIKEIIAEHIVV